MPSNDVEKSIIDVPVSGVVPMQRQRHWFVNITKPLFLKPSRYRCRNILSAKSQRVAGLNCYYFSYCSIFFFCPSLPIGSLYGTKIIWIACSFICNCISYKRQFGKLHVRETFLNVDWRKMEILCFNCIGNLKSSFFFIYLCVIVVCK